MLMEQSMTMAMLGMDVSGMSGGEPSRDSPVQPNETERDSKTPGVMELFKGILGR